MSGRRVTLPTPSIAELVARWRLHPGESALLRLAAREYGMARPAMKAHLVAMGLVLALGDRVALAASAPDPEALRARLGTRALRYARRTLREHRPAADDAITPAIEEREAEDRTPTPERWSRPELERLRQVATAPQAQQLLAAFLEHGCRSLGEVERRYGWSKGVASIVAKRLRAKAAAAASDVRGQGIESMPAAITVRPAVLEDVPWLASRLALAEEFGPHVARSLPTDPAALTAQLERIVACHPVFIAEDGSGPLGFVSGQVLPFLDTLAEEVWWTVDDRRTGRVAALLLDAFLAFGAEHRYRVQIGIRHFEAAGRPAHVAGAGLRTVQDFIRYHDAPEGPC